MCWAVLERLAGKNVRTALIQNPMLSELDILRSILMDLAARPSAEDSPSKSDESGPDVFDSSWLHRMDRKQLLDCLNAFLAERARRDEFTVLIIDESQNLSVNMLEQLRLLSNLETDKKKLLQIIFVGQLELDKKLRRPELRQLNQRISVRFETKHLSGKDAEKYIRHRLIIAGGAPKLKFGRGAFKAIYEYSKGYPRAINLICDRALLVGYDERSFVITKRMVRKAVLSLKGKEEGFLHTLSDWMRRTIPVTGAVMFLIGASLFFAWENGWVTLAKDSVPVPPAVYSLPINASKEPPTPAVTAVSTPKPEMAVTEAKQLPHEANATTPSALEKHGEKKYLLQVHSFLKEEKANPAMRQLLDEGQSSYVQYEINSEGRGWYVVYAGPFDDLGTVRETVAALKKRYSVEPIIRVR
jgi:general secretion pathway protein A